MPNFASACLEKGSEGLQQTTGSRCSEQWLFCAGRLPWMQMHLKVSHLLKCHRSVNRGFTGANEKPMEG